jgi:hypothetical protein
MTKHSIFLFAFLLSTMVPACAAELQGDAAFATGDYTTAYHEWQVLADHGDASAMLGVGTLYDTGHGVPQDFTVALSWYRRAAEAGNVAAAFNVGAMYDNGRGTAKDRREAIKWWRTAAAKGSGRAAYDLGVIYRDGDGVARNTTAAIRFFRLAKRDGIEAAGPSLAALGVPSPASPRQNGIALSRSPHASESELQMAAGFQKTVLARSAMDPATIKSFTDYVPVFLDLALQGNHLAQYDAAFALERGLGVAVDPVRSYVFYLRAAVSEAVDVRAAALYGAWEVSARLTPPQHAAAREMLLNDAP